MKRFDLIESQRTAVPLNAEQAKALHALGTKLASKATWWGETEEEQPPSTVIDVQQNPGNEWSVLVREAVGLISVDGLQLAVSPKIPHRHFLYLASKSGILPRIEDQPAEVAPDASLWEVFAHWFVRGTEKLLHGELAKGYREASDELDCARGRTLPLETADLFYRGRPAVHCEYEDFSENIALNRLLKAACDLVASSSVLDRPLRQRARAALTRMTEVGPLIDGDFRAEVDRLTYRYRDPMAFAKVILRSGGTRLSHGATHGWCFLIRTPDLIESGVLSVLQDRLGVRWRIEKKGRAVKGTALTLNPDLVFNGGLAVGDVKYKSFGSEWSRPDLYQSAAFAAGYDSNHSAVIGFGPTPEARPQPAQLGPILVEAFAWPVGQDYAPEVSARLLADQVSAFLVKASRSTTQLAVA